MDAEIVNQEAEINSDILTPCKKSLDFKPDLKFYTFNSNTFEIYSSPIINNETKIFISTKLLDKFNNQELLFIIGREIGHIIFDHHKILLAPLSKKNELTAQEYIEFANWKKASEVSADRAGLLCCKSYQTACSVLFKLSTGISSTDYKFNPENYMIQFNSIESNFEETYPQDIYELYTSADLNPIRIKTLQGFYCHFFYVGDFYFALLY